MAAIQTSIDVGVPVAREQSSRAPPQKKIVNLEPLRGVVIVTDIAIVWRYMVAVVYSCLTQLACWVMSSESLCRGSRLSVLIQCADNLSVNH